MTRFFSAFVNILQTQLVILIKELPTMQAFQRFHYPSFCTLCVLILHGLLIPTQGLVAQVPSWPQFRGAGSNPVSDGNQLPDQWSASEKVHWSVEVPGRGWSSPVVWGDKVLLTTAVSNKEDKPAQVGTEYSRTYAAELQAQGLSEEEIMTKLRERDFEMPEELSVSYRLYCFDLNEGKELWHQEYYAGKPPAGRHRKNSFTSETPTTDGELIYVYAANLGVFAFNFAGEQVWKKELKNLPIYLDFGSGSSPILVENRLIILNDNEENSEIFALDKKTGQQLWRTQRGEFAEGKRPVQASSWTTPYLWKNSLRTEIITTGPGRVVAYDVDGQELWRLDGARPGPASSPFAIDDQLIVNAGAPTPIFSIKPGAKGDITPSPEAIANAAKSANQKEEAQSPNPVDQPPTDANEDLSKNFHWIYPRSTAYIPTPLAYQGGLFVLSDNGILTRLDLKTGVETFKRRVKASGADFTSSPWAYDGKLFLASEQGQVFVLDAGSEFKILHVNEVGEMIMASPAMVADHLLLRTEKRLISFRKASR